MQTHGVGKMNALLLCTIINWKTYLLENVAILPTTGYEVSMNTTHETHGYGIADEASDENYTQNHPDPSRLKLSIVHFSPSSALGELHTRGSPA